MGGVGMEYLLQCLTINQYLFQYLTINANDVLSL